jgi:hypothetical protein
MLEGAARGLGRRASELGDSLRRGLTGTADAARDVAIAAEKRIGDAGLWQAVAKKPSGALMEILKGKPRINRHLVYNPQEMCSWEIMRKYHGTVLADQKIWQVAGGLLFVAASSVCLVFLFVPRPQDLKMSSFFSLVLYFKVFIAFMLGMYMSFCLKRWWMCMQTLTDFFLGIRKISFFLNSAGVPEETRNAMQRLSMMSAYLLENEVTSIFTTDPEEREKKWRDLVVLMKEDGPSTTKSSKLLSRRWSTTRVHLWCGLGSPVTSRTSTCPHPCAVRSTSSSRSRPTSSRRSRLS